MCSAPIARVRETASCDGVNIVLLAAFLVIEANLRGK